MNPGVYPGTGPAPTLVGATPLAPPTLITSGSGNFIPRLATKWLKVTLLGGGAGGNSQSAVGPCGGGKAALPVTYWIKKTKSSYAYAIGAGGVGVSATAGSAGSDTTFDTLTGYGAQAPGTGAVASSAMTLMGESSPYGKGGSYPAGAASGYGAGGGGTNGNNTTGGNATGGLLIIEEY